MSHEAFTGASFQSLKDAKQLANNYYHAQIWPGHLAVVLLQVVDPSIHGGADASPRVPLFHSVIQKAGGDPVAIQQDIQRLVLLTPAQLFPRVEIDLSPALVAVINNAESISKDMRDQYIAHDHLLLALIEDPDLRAIFTEAGLSEATLKNAVRQIRGDHRVESKSAEPSLDALAKYAIDMTKLAEEGKLDPVIGRDDEVRRMIRILCRRTKNNVVIIGEPGVGKTALAELLAQRIVKRDVPASLFGRLFSLEMGTLIAGTKYRGEYEERVKSVLNEIEKNAEQGADIILFIDEMHLIMAGKGDGEGSGMDAANLLKPVLARGKLRCIGATTLAEYRKYIEKDAAFERRFAQVLVNEPSVADTVSILRGISEKYEVHHGVRILDAALIQAATLAHRYLTSKRLPDSAIDLVDEACANVRVARETSPEAIDTLERRKLQLQVEIHALSREKDDASVERLKIAEKAVADIENELAPLRAAYELENQRGKDIADVRKRIDELCAKADDAERRYQLPIASNLRYHEIPNLQKRLATLEKALEEEDAKRGGVGADTVMPEAIAEVVARAANIPVGKLLSTEKEKLIKMERTLANMVVGQPEAVKAVANAIRLSRSGLSNEDRPIASFLFAGPSGTGKTLLSKTLANLLFDSPNAMIRIDASEYSEKLSLSRLIGAPPGYVGHDAGGQLTEYVRRKPYSIVLVDEVEKACREFVMLFLQVLDDGRLTDSQGRVVDFRNTVIIMTSNLGAAYLQALPGGPIPPETCTLAMSAIETHFPPEFRNRIDEIIIYRPLSPANIRKIVDIRLVEFSERLAPRKLTLELDDAAKDLLSSIGYSPTYGARPLNRIMQEQILNPLAMMLLQEKICDGEVVLVGFDGTDRLVIVPNHSGVQLPANETDVGGDDLFGDEVE